MLPFAEKDIEEFRLNFPIEVKEKLELEDDIEKLALKENQENEDKEATFGKVRFLYEYQNYPKKLKFDLKKYIFF